MRRGGRGAAAPPPAFGQRRSFFGAAAMVGGGVFQFSGGRMTSRRQCPEVSCRGHLSLPDESTVYVMNSDQFGFILA